MMRICWCIHGGGGDGDDFGVDVSIGDIVGNNRGVGHSSTGDEGMVQMHKRRVVLEWLVVCPQEIERVVWVWLVMCPQETEGVV